ncbi:uncharacterized protein [Physcomitrium patens]|uniref:Histidine phosphatase family protein n=2 Tax=Physcomitrium patens TaxID=3218 RepID=A0A2K1KGR8_PHYPA|nr:metal-independent phosphoserine phosphatase-like isoform X1 [Physcomitrium patens]PNR52968.1 hypothetical protein PHYPA_009343 [Physcomitrium patens]|eukprot:XP_024379093.1 metal-independent phosphoserine phosphatase-like isoform X1 [Physcomitrella patens]
MTQGLLKNRYWVLRHGRSVPNEAGLIVSHLSNGVLPNYGLAPSGFLQAEAAGALFLKELEMAGIPLDQVRIFASPFSRTLETAKVVADSMGVLMNAKPTIKFLEELRERYFGPPLELQSHEHYPEIWAIDAIDPLVGPDGGESVADVAIRVSEAIMQMESEVQGCGVLVVSHGDTLQILQTVTYAALATMSSAGDGTLASLFADAITRPVLSRHREYSLLTGELRRLAEPVKDI